MAKLPISALVALTLLAAALVGCGSMNGPGSGVYGGVDTGGEIRR